MLDVNKAEIVSSIVFSFGWFMCEESLAITPVATLMRYHDTNWKPIMATKILFITIMSRTHRLRSTVVFTLRDGKI